MTTHRSPAAVGSGLAPPVLATWLSAFRDCFTAPVWKHVLVLVAGAVLAPRKRTVSEALRVMGLAARPGFARYHEVLSRARWNGRAVARRLLAQLLDVFLPEGEVVIGIDDTIERRWGARIKARGIYRDPVRSSHGHFVKASGLRWLSLMVVVPIPWAGRRWALPFLTVLAPSERWSDARGRRHKKLTDWARQAILQAKHWLAKRRVISVADSSFAALDLIAAERQHICLVTRLRLDANLFAPAPARRAGQRGRPPLTGARLPKLTAVLADPKTVWSSITLPEWYGGQQRTLEIMSGMAVWYHSGLPPAPIRWVLARDPAGKLKRFWRPTLKPVRRKSSAGSSRAGAWKRRSRKSAPISASRPSANAGDRTHHPGAARAVLPGDDLDARIDRNPWRRHPSPDGRLVWKARTDLQRRHRHRPPCPLVPAGFMDVPA
jgi:hypothetical protein